MSEIVDLSAVEEGGEVVAGELLAAVWCVQPGRVLPYRAVRHSEVTVVSLQMFTNTSIGSLALSLKMNYNFFLNSPHHSNANATKLLKSTVCPCPFPLLKVTVQCAAV